MTDKNRLAKIEDALLESHRARPEIETGSDWNMRTMAEVRRHGRLWNAERDYVVTQRIVWRFAMAASTFALILSMYASGRDIGPAQLAASIIFGDSSIAFIIM